jgi:hypothetical protein
VKLDRAAVVTTYALAAGVCLSASLLTGIGSVVPILDAISQVGALLPFAVTDRTVTVSLFVCLPLALALAVVARASITRTPADTVLAAFAIPCLLATTWTLAGYVWTSLGVSLGTLISLGAGLLLSIVLLADGIITHVAVPEHT